MEAVKRALEFHAASPEVVQAACAVVRNFAVDSWGDSEARSVHGRFDKKAARAANVLPGTGAAWLIKDVGCIDAIVTAMKAHEQSASVQTQGCGALRNCACGTVGDPESRVALGRAITEADGLSTICRAMAEHPSEQSVQAQGCGALRNLAANVPLKRRLIEPDIVAAVVRAMTSQNEPPSGGKANHGWTALWQETLEQGASFIANLLCVSPRVMSGMSDVEYTEHMSDACDAAEVVCAAGGVEALTRAIMRKPYHATIAAHGTAALSLLLSKRMGGVSLRRREAIASGVRSRLYGMEGSVQALANVVVHHAADVEVKRHCVPCLCLLAEEQQEGVAERAFLSISNAIDVIEAIRPDLAAGLLRGNKDGGLARLHALLQQGAAQGQGQGQGPTTQFGEN